MMIEWKCFYFIHIFITKKSSESCFRQLSLSCSQNNFIVLELFAVSFQIFQECRRNYQPVRMAETSSRFVEFIEEQKKKKQKTLFWKHEFLIAKNEVRKVKKISPEELNGYISEFTEAVRRKDGKRFWAFKPERANAALTALESLQVSYYWRQRVWTSATSLGCLRHRKQARHSRSYNWWRSKYFMWQELTYEFYSLWIARLWWTSSYKVGKHSAS